MKYCFKTCHSKEDFRERLDVYCKHWRGNHERCTHSRITTRSYQPFTRRTTNHLVKTHFQPLLQNWEKHLHGKTTNRCESFNGLIAHFAPKSQRYPTTYHHLVNLAVLRKTIGIKYPIIILHALGVPISEEIRHFFEEKERKALKDTERKRGEQFKRRRGHLRSQKALNKQNRQSQEFTYGSVDQTPKVCGHEQCKNRQCICIRACQACSTQCGCHGECANWYNSTGKSSSVV